MVLSLAADLGSRADRLTKHWQWWAGFLAENLDNLPLRSELVHDMGLDDEVLEEGEVMVWDTAKELDE